MRFLHLFIAFFIALFILGCGAEKRAVSIPQKSLPSWYTSPPLSNSTELYAIGDGKNKDEALANALTLMASTLSVSVSSEFNAKTVVKSGRVNSSDGTYTNDVTSKVSQIRISNYELLESASLGFKKYAVLIRSNKTKLFESMLQETKQEFSLISSKEESLSGANALKRLSFYKNTQESVQEIPNRLVVMSVLNPAFKQEAYLQKLQEIDAKYEALMQKLDFSLMADKDGENLKGVVAKALSSKGIKITASKSSATHFTLVIQTAVEEANAYGFTLARTDIRFITKDVKGVVVGSNTLNIVGQSTQGIAIAKQSVAIQLNERIEKEGVGQILGLDI
ncbi:MAG: LPP20 family lipoprotein [Campylobacterales bacterium]|nr:LPP20 family lipoprotein [Campylobacterales bacterium]